MTCAMSLAHSSNLRSFAGFVHHHGPAFSFIFETAGGSRFDWPDETWVLDHFETHDLIGTDPYESRALFEPPPAA
jgi:hypothetical protein